MLMLMLYIFIKFHGYYVLDFVTGFQSTSESGRREHRNTLNRAMPRKGAVCAWSPP